MTSSNYGGSGTIDHQKPVKFGRSGKKVAGNIGQNHHNQYEGQSVARSLEKLQSGASSRNMGVGVSSGGNFALSSADVQHLQLKSTTST